MRRLVPLICALAVLLPAGSASAQQSLQVPIQFDFLNPGARSLGLGSAFVAVADDATAAWSNPAGLANLPDREVSAEGRYNRLEQPFLERGRLSGAPTGIGEDVLAAPEFVDILDQRAGLSFGSFVQPIGAARIAVYRHELLRVEQRFDYRGIFQNRGFDIRDRAFSAAREMRIDSYGVSAGWPREGAVRLGAGLAVARLSLGFDFSGFLHETFRGAPDPTQELLHFTQSGKDWALGATAGALVSVMGGAATVGVAYQRGPTFAFSSVATPLVGLRQVFEGNFKVPDVVAIGLSTRPFIAHDTWLFTVEYKRLQHSQLERDYVDVLVNQGEDAIAHADGFSVPDSNEFHAGVEYAFLVAGEPTVRGGVWFDPDHSVQYAPSPVHDLFDERLDVSLSSGRDLWHYSLGFGVALSDRFELNIAADVTSRSTILSSSIIVRFPSRTPQPPRTSTP